MIKFTQELEEDDANYQATKSITFELFEDQNLPGIIESFKSFLLAIGFHPDTVDAYLGEAKETKDSDE